MKINDPAASCGVFGGIRTGSGHYHQTQLIRRFLVVSGNEAACRYYPVAPVFTYYCYHIFTTCCPTVLTKYPINSKNSPPQSWDFTEGMCLKCTSP